MTAAAGTITTNTTEAIQNSDDIHDVWKIAVTFNLVSGDTTGTATVPLNGIMRQVVAKLSDMADAEGTTDVVLSNDDDDTIFTATDLAESLSHVFAVDDAYSSECNIALAFDDPGAAGATVVITFRGI